MSLKEKLSKEKSVAKVAPQQYFRSNEFLSKLASVAGNLQDAKAIVQSYLSSYLTNAELMATDIKSQVACLIKTAALKLLPNTPLGHAHIVPYAGKATFQLGYQGIVELCRRAGVLVFAQEVYSNDEFEYTIHDGEKHIKHIPKPGGHVVGVYAGWRSGDFKDISVWSIERIIEHARKYSKSYNNPKGAWMNVLNPDVCPVNIWMAKKTVLIDALKLAPKTSELARVIKEDIEQDLPQYVNTQDIEENIIEELETQPEEVENV